MPHRRFDAVIFDLDGTLCDSEPFIAAAAAEALRRRYGIVVPREDFAPFVGGGDDWFISGAAAKHGVTADLAIDKPLTYEVYLELIPGALQPIRGALAFIAALRAAGLRVALATGSDLPKLRGNLAAIGLAETSFDVVVSADGITRKKPDPETFSVAIERLGLDAARCLVVEDARNGVLAGCAAGCEVLGIASSQSAESLLAAGARVVAPDYTEIPSEVLADLGLAWDDLGLVPGDPVAVAGPPTTVVFDLGGVLIDWSPRALFREYLADDAAVDAFLAEVGFSEWNATLDAGRPWAEAVADLAARHPHRRELIEAFHTRWAETLQGEITGTVELLRTLRDVGIRVLALSNWSSDTYVIASGVFPFLGWFDGITISGEVGVGKPDPRIFEHFIARFAVEPAGAVYIDDNAPNVAAAARLGFRAVRFTSPEALRDDLAAMGLPLR
jgi:2-haloacid dehalogenase